MADDGENQEHDGHFAAVVQEMEDELALFGQMILQDDLSLEEITDSNLSLELQEVLKELFPVDAADDLSTDSSASTSNSSDPVDDPSPSSSASSSDAVVGDGAADHEIMEVDVADGKLEIRIILDNF